MSTTDHDDASTQRKTAPVGSTLAKMIELKEAQLEIAAGNDRKTFEGQLRMLRSLAEAYHPDTVLSTLPERIQVEYGLIERQSGGPGAFGGGGAGRLNGLAALGQLALQHPFAALALALGVAAIYPLEQFAVNRAAYWGNPATQAQSDLTREQARAANAPAYLDFERRPRITDPFNRYGQDNSATGCLSTDSKRQGGSGYPRGSIPTNQAALAKPLPCP